jgi:hypothetical protein
VSDLAANERGVQHFRQLEIGDELAFASQKTPVFLPQN